MLDQRNVIDTDLVGKTDKEKSNELKKQQATILKILLWIEPDFEKGVANSLHEVMFDFQNNLTTWVNHREMGKLVPECYFHFGGQDSGKNDNQHIQEILFERGFIPNAPDRSNEELTQVAN